MRALLCNVGHSGRTADPHPRHHVAPIDLALCAAILERDGWTVELWDTQVTPHARPEQIAARARAVAPELLLLRPLHGCEEATAQLLGAVGSRPVRLLMGPSAPHLAARWWGSDAEPARLDGALMGEPEGTLIELLPSLRRGELPQEPLLGLAAGPDRPAPPRPLLTDLDALPLPAHHLLVKQGYQFRYPLDVRTPLRIGYSLSSRGCAVGCLFCAPVERETVGRRYRWRSAANVVDELEQMRSLGFNAVYFIDDFFGFSRQRIAELCEAMLSRDVVLPWAAQVRAQGLDPEVLRLMRRAGCSTLCFGAESGSDRLLQLLNKGITTAQIREQARSIRAADIQSVGYFIVGIPGESDAERAATYRLIEELRPDVVQIHIFNVFPGAPAMERWPELHDPGATKFTGPRTRDAHLAALDAERRAFYRRYYLEPRYLARTLRRRWRPLLANLAYEADFARRVLAYFLGWS